MWLQLKPSSLPRDQPFLSHPNCPSCGLPLLLLLTPGPTLPTFMILLKLVQPCRL